MDNIDFRTLSKSAQAEVRRRAVYSYLSAGRKGKVKLAKFYQVTFVTFVKWIANYDAIGEKSFADDKRGTKEFQNSSLNKKQLNWLKKQLVDKTPEQLKFSFALWTRKFGIKVDASTAGEYLKKFGMTQQKPVLKSYKQQPALVRAWLDEKYPKLSLRAKEEKSLIFWGDETAIRSQDQVGRGRAIALKQK